MISVQRNGKKVEKDGQKKSFSTPNYESSE